jgi:nucleotide-binding universal stress UspA family protein
MKAVMGVEPEGVPESALDLLAALQLEDLELTLVYACEPPVFNGGFGASFGVIQAEAAEAVQKHAHSQLDAFSQRAAEKGIRTESVLTYDAPAHALEATAERISADLVVAHGAHGNSPHAPVLGSVRRALLNSSHRSMLFAKAGPRRASGLRAVYATDHSPYAERCLARLLALRPKGIEELDVLTVYEPIETGPPAAHVSLENYEHLVRSAVAHHVHTLTEGVAARLRSAGYRSNALVRVGEPNLRIRQVMEETGADLLLLGAQGHGFLERLFVGSISHHQALHEPYPVLLLRE